MPPAAMSKSSACRTDGLLKDASEIEWYNDAEDDSLMVPPPAPANNGTLNSFVCHSGHAIKPTEKICETLVASSTSAKCQENDDKDNEDTPALEDVTDDEEEDAENAEKEEAYQWMKKLGDHDHEDCKSLKKDECNADLTTVFTFKKGCLNPHTQEHENRWWCEATLDASLPPKIPVFMKSGLMDYIVELIVAEDEVSDFNS
ncbi:uncharacterized protein BJ212DRAFT_1482172 [Suillus subaureus]|uniref:Uncharacterized protein n=1 Tax=Suillus subaureus TaxID=48587 RepID=A0A9P7E9A0_9AGAM|nr:uncharacterized protein BJ212DRAFT_1482172 [Suillus subaureus]KAG1814441.1 hypothetical protein BJ212DRAFT_1482172 [Suillus subaureus]